MLEVLPRPDDYSLIQTVERHHDLAANPPGSTARSLHSFAHHGVPFRLRPLPRRHARDYGDHEVAVVSVLSKYRM